MHRPATRAEIERKVGERAFGRMPCTNHDAFDASLHVELGRTARGTRIALHHEVARADVRVLVGCVEPHVQAGFGGGYKNLCPGVAAADAIGHNHCLGAGPHDLGRIGGAPEAIPMRQDLEEFGRRLPGTTFAVNVVLDARQRVVKLAAGDADRVHRACIEAARTLYGVEVSEPADVVITGSHPLDLNVRQGVKSIVNVLGAARPGGVIVSLNRCELGLDDLPLPRLPLPPDWLVRRFLKLVRPEGIDFLLGRLPRSLPPENRFFVHFALQALARNRIVVYSPNLARDLAGVRLPVLVSADLDQVLAEAVRLAPARRRARCLVFPSGGVSYPIVTAGGASRPEGRGATMSDRAQP